MSNSRSPLFRYRKENHLTLEALAERLKVNRSTVLRWEEGRVPAERVLEIERATGVSRQSLRPDIYPPSEAAAYPTLMELSHGH